MKITTDWHIHSRNSCDQACMTLADLVKGAGEQGIVDYGLTDHIHTPYNLPDLYAARAEFDEVVNSPRVHFGVEVSVVSQWELDELARTEYPGEPVYGIRKGGPEGAAPAIGLAEEEMRALGIEYVVGGVHWPLYAPIEREAIIRDYHRQNMFLATHPLVSVIAHPWWWMGAWKDADGVYRSAPWLDDFGHVPQAMHEEFAAATREHWKAVEINLEGMVLTEAYPERFKEQYLEYLAWLQGEGVALSIGSDCHGRHYSTEFEKAAERLEKAGIEEGKLWRLAPR